MRMRSARSWVAMVVLTTTVGCSTWRTEYQPVPRLLADGPRHVRLHLRGDSAVEMRRAVLLGDSAVADLRREGSGPARVVPVLEVTAVDTHHSSAKHVVVGVAVGTLVVAAAAVAYVIAAFSGREG